MSSYIKNSPPFTAKAISCTGVMYTWTGSSPALTISASRTDSVKRVKPKGIELLFSPVAFSHERYFVSNTFMHYKSSCTAQQQAVSGLRHVMVPTSVKDYHGLAAPACITTARTGILQSRLLGKVKGQKVNLAVALAQYRQTASLFNNYAQLICDIYYDVRRKRPTRKSSISAFRKRGSKEILVYNYGVTPLVSDIEGSLSALDKAVERGIVLKVKANDTQHNYRAATYGSNVSEIASRDISEHRTDRAVCYAEIQNSFTQTLSSTGFLNPAFVMWDLIPYSFIVDWFIDVGTYLDNLDALTGVKRISASYTYKQQATETRVSIHGAQATARRERTGRVLLALDPLSVRPQFGKGMSVTRALNALALISVRLKTPS